MKLVKSDQSNFSIHVVGEIKMAKFDEELIIAVKDYQCLYNTKSSDFKNSWRKENAWTSISKKLNTTGK